MAHALCSDMITKLCTVFACSTSPKREYQANITLISREKSNGFRASREAASLYGHPKGLTVYRDRTGDRYRYIDI
jgi:hypothetical protein